MRFSAEFHSKAGLPVLLLVLFVTSGVVLAQKPTPPSATGLALEIGLGEGNGSQGRVLYAAVAPASAVNSGVLSTGPLEPIHQGSSKISSLVSHSVLFFAKVEGDAVRVGMEFVPKDSDEPWTPIASYLLRRYEPVTVKELESYGLKPIELRVVDLKTAPIGPPSVTNETNSLQVVDIERNPSDVFPSFVLNLKNTNRKTVIAVSATVYYQDGSSEPVGTGSFWSYDAVQPRTTGSLRVFSREGVLASEGYVPDAPIAVSIETVVFDDGSYEGEAGPVGSILAERAGYVKQLSRVLSIINKAIDSHNTNVASISDSIASLSQEPDDLDLEKVLSGLRESSNSTASQTDSSYRNGLSAVKTTALSRMQQLQKIVDRAKAGKSAVDVDVPAFLKATRVVYEKWLASQLAQPIQS